MKNLALSFDPSRIGIALASKHSKILGYLKSEVRLYDGESLRRFGAT